MHGVLRVFAVLAGALLVVSVWRTAILVLVVPRSRRLLLYQSWVALLRAPVMALARRLPYPRRDSFLTPITPFLLISLVPFWLALFGLGYGLVFAGVGDLSLPFALREAGSSLFTLGFSAPAGRLLTVLSFAAAITGPLVIALLIGYLPTLYGAFNRRETQVSMLAGRGGDPVWGPIILQRYHWSGLTAELPVLYADWERWSADIAESHTSYPALAFFRSPDPRRNWITSLMAVMDAAALQLARTPSTAPGISRLVITGGVEAVRSICSVQNIAVRDDPRPTDPISVSFTDFRVAWDLLDRTGFPAEVDARTAYLTFRGWRVNWEANAFELARRLHAPPLDWTGPRDGNPPMLRREPVRNRSFEDPEGLSPPPRPTAADRPDPSGPDPEPAVPDPDTPGPDADRADRELAGSDRAGADRAAENQF